MEPLISDNDGKFPTAFETEGSESGREQHGSGFTGKTTVFTTVEYGLICKTNRAHWKFYHGKNPVNRGYCGVGRRADSSGISQAPTQVVCAIAHPKPERGWIPDSQPDS